MEPSRAAPKAGSSPRPDRSGHVAVWPERGSSRLPRRGRFRAEYPGPTLRDHLGRPRQPLAQVPPLRYPRLLAADGPKMLALAAEIADGALPILVPASYTMQARRVLGPDKILVVGVTVAVDEDPQRAPAAARQFVSEVVGRPGSPYAANLIRLGCTLADIGAASDALVGALIPWGAPEQVMAGIRRHLRAGADHVRVGTMAPDFGAAQDAWGLLAPALTIPGTGPAV